MKHSRRKGCFETKWKIQWKKNLIAVAKRRKLALRMSADVCKAAAHVWRRPVLGFDIGRHDIYADSSGST